RSALRIDVNRAPLLEHGTRHIFGMTDQLQVGQPAENRGHPKKRHASQYQQSDVDFFLLHGSWDSARAPDGWKTISKLAGLRRSPSLRRAKHGGCAAPGGRTP